MSETATAAAVRRPAPTEGPSRPAGARGLSALPLWLAVCLLSIWLTAVDNAPLFGEIARVAGPPSTGNLSIYLGVTALLLVVHNLVLGLVAWPGVFRPVLVLLLVAEAIVAYFSTRYGVVVDRVMIQNLLETDVREASDLLSPAFVATLLFLGIDTDAYLPDRDIFSGCRRPESRPLRLTGTESSSRPSGRNLGS